MELVDMITSCGCSMITEQRWNYGPSGLILFLRQRIPSLSLAIIGFTMSAEW